MADTYEGFMRVVFALAEDIGEGDEPEGWQTVLSAGVIPNRPAIGGKPPRITTALMDKWIAEFDRRGREVPIDLHHATLTAAVKNDPRYLDPVLSGARAWVKGLKRVGDDLLALFKWTKDGATLIREKKFKFPSIEFDSKTVIGGTLTNHPAADVPAFALSQAAYEHLDAEAGGATTEPAKYPSAESNTEGMEETMPDEIKALAALLGCSEDEVTAKVTALNKGRETAAAVALAVKTKDDEIAALTAQLAERDDADFATALSADVFADGRMTNDDDAKAALRIVWDTDRDKFTALTKAMKPGTVPVRKAKGIDSQEPAEDDGSDEPNGALDAGDKLHALATTLITDNIDYSAAYALACEQQPEWLIAYEGGDGRDI